MTAKEYRKQEGKNKRKNKYNAVKQTYNDYSYDSTMEANYAYQLDLRKKSGEIEKWERQHKWQLYVNGKKITQYTIDFRIINIDGTIDYVEIKGAENYAFQLRWKLVQALFEQLTEGEKANLYKKRKIGSKELSR